MDENLDEKLVPEYDSDNAGDDASDAEALDAEYEESNGQEDGSPEDEEYAEDGEQDTADDVISKKQYDNLRRDYTKKSMELADLKRRGTKADAVLPTVTKPATVQEFIDQKIEEALNDRIAPIQEQQEDLRIQATVKALSDKYEDFDEVADAFIEVLEQNEELFNMPNGLDIAFQAARSTYIENAAEATAIAAAKARAATVAAKASLADANSARKQPSAPQSEEDKIKESILSAGGHGGTFNF